jgi:hypothetical protein
MSYALFGLAALVVVAGFAWVLVRAERVGSLDCPCRVRSDMLSTHLTVAREGNGPRPPTVQLRVAVPLHFVAHRMSAEDAQTLAGLLETAAGALREP